MDWLLHTTYLMVLYTLSEYSFQMFDAYIGRCIKVIEKVKLT